ncbi:STAS domain-containing protein [Actinosynnema sp. CA-248983]
MATPHRSEATDPTRTAVSPLPGRVDPIARDWAVHIGSTPTRLAVRVRGLLDHAGAAFLAAQVVCALGERPRPVLVDLADAAVVDPAARVVLRRLAESVRARGSRCAVVGFGWPPAAARAMLGRDGYPAGSESFRAGRPGRPSA